MTTPVRVGGGPSVSPTRMGSQEIGSPSGSINPEEVRNAQPFDTSINEISDKHRDPALTLSKVIGHKLSKESSAGVYLRCRMNFMNDSVLTESPTLMNLGLSSVHPSDELGSFRIPATRIRRAINVSNWIPPGHLIGEVTLDRMSRTRSEKNYRSKTHLETRR